MRRYRAEQEQRHTHIHTQIYSKSGRGERGENFIYIVCRERHTVLIEFYEQS